MKEWGFGYGGFMGWWDGGKVGIVYKSAWISWMKWNLQKHSVHYFALLVLLNLEYFS